MLEIFRSLADKLEETKLSHWSSDISTNSFHNIYPTPFQKQLIFYKKGKAVVIRFLEQKANIRASEPVTSFLAALLGNYTNYREKKLNFEQGVSLICFQTAGYLVSYFHYWSRHVQKYLLLLLTLTQVKKN